MSDDNHFEDRILLKDLIRQVRTELGDAMNERETSGGAPMFVLNKLTLEINFVVEKGGSVEAEASGKVWALVGVKAGGNLNTKTEQVHKITLELSPYASPKAEPGGIYLDNADPFPKGRGSNPFEPIILANIESHLKKQTPIILENFMRGKKFTHGSDGKFSIDLGDSDLSG